MMNDAEYEQGKEIVAALKKVPNPSPLDYWMANKGDAMMLAIEAADWIERQMEEYNPN
jgi:hypothetical protein